MRLATVACGDLLRNLPPLLVLAGSDELVFTDALRLQAKAESHGVDVQVLIWEGMWHSWLLLTRGCLKYQRRFTPSRRSFANERQERTGMTRNKASGLRMSKWAGVVFLSVVFPAVHGVLPWAISRLFIRHGWFMNLPGPWNFPGLLLVGAGAWIAAWALSAHVAATNGEFRLKRTPDYFLTTGPYRFARNPMYIGEALIWAGWTILFGSAALLLLLIACAALSKWLTRVVVMREERDLEKRFGAEYREYLQKVPRWGFPKHLI
jgi:protein-S-isoprenylcysteine O-methyltransferase Ste14